MIRWFASLLCCVSLAQLSLVQADEIDNWFNRMQLALDTQNFQGTLVIRQLDQLHAMRVVHGHGEPGHSEPGKGSWDTLETMNGEHRRVIRRGAQVITLFPDKNTATRIQDNALKTFPLHPRITQNMAQLKQLYHVKLAGRDRVAGWPAQIIEMLPKDPYRYGFRLWLARDNGLLLRSDLLGEHGQVVEQVMYTQLSIMKQVPPPGVPDLNTWQVSDLTVASVSAVTAESVAWEIRQLPPGFRLIQTTRLPVHNAAANAAEDGQIESVQHYIFSDGMTSVSVFVEPRQTDNSSLIGVSRMGAVNAFGQAVNDHHVTVIGEVPLVTVRQIAQSIVQTPALDKPEAEVPND